MKRRVRPRQMMCASCACGASCEIIRRVAAPPHLPACRPFAHATLADENIPACYPLWAVIVGGVLLLRERSLDPKPPAAVQLHLFKPKDEEDADLSLGDLFETLPCKAVNHWAKKALNRFLHFKCWLYLLTLRKYAIRIACYSFARFAAVIYFCSCAVLTTQRKRTPR